MPERKVVRVDPTIPREKRPPRNRLYRGSYWAHRMQGFAAGLLLGPIFGQLPATAGYLVYQCVEFQRIRKLADDEWFDKVDDNPSRDVMDWLAFLWVGMAVHTIVLLAGVGVGVGLALRPF